MGFFRRLWDQGERAAAPFALGARERLGMLDTRGLRIRARELSFGYSGGLHRALRKGPGVEFVGHRPYTPGDDLRHLDRHALLRHGSLLIREFSTETERPVHLVIDATESMRYRRDGSESKLERAAVLALALGYVARRSGDPVGLTLLSNDRLTALPAKTGGEHFERLVTALEGELARSAAERESSSDDGVDRPGGRALASMTELAGRLSPRSVVLLFSDFFDFANEGAGLVGGLATQKREVVAVRVLDPAEVTFPFRGATRLVDPEASDIVEADADAARDGYLASSAKLESNLRHELTSRRGRFLSVTTTDEPSRTLREILAP